MNCKAFQPKRGTATKLATQLKSTFIRTKSPAELYQRPCRLTHAGLNEAAIAHPANFGALVADVRGVDWLVYAKKPFGGPAQALAYLGRYTHRVAIANSRFRRVADSLGARRFAPCQHR